MKSVVLVLGILMLSGCVTAPKMPGKLINVGGHSMRIDCTGPQGDAPTVIVEAGLRSVGAFYSRLQGALETRVRVCTYDRAGLGWSDETEAKRDSKQMARELHELLVNANIRPPVVLAGHSIGGLVVVRYAHDYPNEVAGIALLDATHPENYSLYRNSREGTAAAVKSTKRLRWLTWTGLCAVYTPAAIKATIERLPDEARDQMMYFVRKPAIATKMLNTAAGEFSGMEDSFSQVAEVKTLGSMPLLVITADKHYMGGAKASEEDRAWWQHQADGWRKLHEQYAALSTRGRHVVFSNADHESLFTNQANAELAAKEVISLVGDANASRR